MKSVTLIFLAFSFSVSAEVFKISGDLQEYKAQDNLLLRGCEKDCLALKTIAEHKKINLKTARKGLTYYNSVGADACRYIYKSSTLMGVTTNGDQRAFCVFKDNSSVEINSLSQYLVNKKIVTE